MGNVGEMSGGLTTDIFEDFIDSIEVDGGIRVLRSWFDT